jgi:hypothetical protein
MPVSAIVLRQNIMVAHLMDDTREVLYDIVITDRFFVFSSSSAWCWALGIGHQEPFSQEVIVDIAIL